MCWAFSDLKASSVRKYFPRDGLSSLPPPTTTGFNASSMPGLQEVMGIIEAFPAIWISRTNNHSQICSASQDLPPEVKVGWLECFYRWNRTSWWAGLLFVSHYVKFWLFWQQHEEYKVIYWICFWQHQSHHSWAGVAANYAVQPDLTALSRIIPVWFQCEAMPQGIKHLWLRHIQSPLPHQPFLKSDFYLWSFSHTFSFMTLST